VILVQILVCTILSVQMSSLLPDGLEDLVVAALIQCAVFILVIVLLSKLLEPLSVTIPVQCSADCSVFITVLCIVCSATSTVRWNTEEYT
jgi:hypothetical protein